MFQDKNKAQRTESRKYRLDEKGLKFVKLCLEEMMTGNGNMNCLSSS